MKLRILIIWYLSAVASLALAQTVVELPQVSQRATIRQRIGLTDIEVNYSRPSVNGRKIWGDVVPYGFTLPTVDGLDKAPWKTGANLNTTLAFTHDVKIEGKPVKAGKYGFFAAMHEDGTATMVLSRTNSAYGQYFYREEEDVLRATVTTRSIPHTELLTFSFEEVRSNQALLSLRWETKEVPVKVEVDVHAIYRSSQFNRAVETTRYVHVARSCAGRTLHD